MNLGLIVLCQGRGHVIPFPLVVHPPWPHLALASIALLMDLLSNLNDPPQCSRIFYFEERQGPVITAFLEQLVQTLIDGSLVKKVCLRCRENAKHLLAQVGGTGSGGDCDGLKDPLAVLTLDVLVLRFPYFDPDDRIVDVCVRLDVPEPCKD